jgi:hypothetical protein
MFLQNERGLGVKNGTLGIVERVSAQSMTVQTDDGRSVQFDLKDYNKIDHGYAATIHKAQGMTVDRTHVLATPGMDAHGSYVALSRHRDGLELHYGRDDFAGEGRLVRTLSRNRAKDMASDYERADPAQSYAERREIAFRERVAEIVRKVVPEKLRGMFDGLRPSADTAPGPDEGQRPERETPEKERSGTPAERRQTEAPARKVAQDPEAEARRVRTRALVRHARAVDAIFEAQEMGGKASPEQVKQLQAARRVFEPPGATSRRCSKPTARLYSIQLVHCSMLLSWGWAPTVIQPRCCRESPCCRNANAGSPPSRKADPRSGSPPPIQ